MVNGRDVVPGLVTIGTNDAVGWSAKMHNLTGNFGLADGSVQRGSSGTFRTFLSRTGTNVTRLAVP
jgi:prepilin-type processing-associated H-X9-DG protein